MHQCARVYGLSVGDTGRFLRIRHSWVHCERDSKTAGVAPKWSVLGFQVQLTLFSLYSKIYNNICLQM